MDVVSRLSGADVFVEIEPNDEIGAPSNPTPLPIEMAVSLTRRLPDSPTWVGATWVTDADAIPTKFYAKRAMAAGMAEGVWWPFVRINGSAGPIVDGPPFRVT